MGKNLYHINSATSSSTTEVTLLKLVLILNAGHSAPMDQPQWTLRMVEAFINDQLG